MEARGRSARVYYVDEQQESWRAAAEPEEPQSRRAAGPASRRAGEPQSRRAAEPASRRAGEP